MDSISVSGLEGVVAARTRLSDVDGAVGRLTIAGYAVEDLAPRASFEEVVHLLLQDRLPDPAERSALDAELARGRALSPRLLDLLRAAAVDGADPMNALALVACGGLAEDASPVALVGRIGAAAATYVRVCAGKEPVPAPAEPGLGHAAAFLWLLEGQQAAAARARALETYWNTVVDHGMNASTFTARVIASTGSDLGSAVAGALGALKGPLHGGAPGPALAAFFELRAAGGDLDGATRAWVRRQVGRGERIMGFGHRVYRVRDPRADVLAGAAEVLLAGSGLLDEARVFERSVVETLAEVKPGRSIQTNVEFYTALLLHGVGLAAEQFTPAFAAARVAGWVAHFGEQQEHARLIRPSSEYVGATGRSFPA